MWDKRISLNCEHMCGLIVAKLQIMEDNFWKLYIFTFLPWFLRQRFVPEAVREMMNKTQVSILLYFIPKCPSLKICTVQTCSIREMMKF